jgi:indolepyruvate decarboxylase
MAPMKLAESLLHALKDRGAGEVFGIPGDFALPFFEVMERTRILPYYTLSHEPAVGFAADAAARYRTGLGIAAVTYGAGAFNLVNPIACAYSEKSPVVVISGAPGARETSRGLLLHHQAKTLASQLEVYREITCDQAVLDDPATAPEEIDRVLRSALDQSRPVYIELPRDVVNAPTRPVPQSREHEADPDAVAACADEILERLRAARDPVLMAGVEVRRYGLEARVASLARRLGIPVTTSFLGRGLFADHDCPFAGTYLGLAGDPEVSALVEGADVLLLMGVILSDTNFGVSARQVDLRRAIDASDGQVRVAHHLYPDVPIEALIDALLARASAATQPVRAGVAAPTVLDDLVADDAPIAPDDIARAVNDLFRRYEPMPMAADMGDCLFTAMDMENTALVAPGYYATMGFGVPAGLGLQAASGRRPLVLVGDGAFQMTGWELGNCRRYGWDPIVLVFNNSGWEMLAAFQPDMPYNRLDDWPFADFARHLGGDGIRVRTRHELAIALERAIATRGRFQLIDIVLPRGQISRRLERFVGAAARQSGLR